MKRAMRWSSTPPRRLHVLLVLLVLITIFPPSTHGEKPPSSFNAAIPRVVWVHVPNRDPSPPAPSPASPPRVPPDASASPITSLSSWVSLNPDFEVRVYEDHDASAFIHQHFSSHVAAIYDTLPLGVMRADVWRYAVLYVHGGIYTDSDTTCVRPVESWLSSEDERTWANCGLLVGAATEDEHQFFSQRVRNNKKRTGGMSRILDCFSNKYMMTIFM